MRESEVQSAEGNLQLPGGALEVVTALAVCWFGRFLDAHIAEQTAAAR